MNKFLFSFGLILSVTITANAQFKDFLKKVEKTVLGEDISELDASSALKQALEIGTKEAVDKLSEENGYYDSPYKVLLPEEARKVSDKLKFVPGFSDVEDKLVEKMNQAAELAVTEATPIFVDAITDMTFSDAMNILLGEKNAATKYLEKSTYEKLYASFLPIIRESLDEVGARSYWREATTAYNKIPFTSDVNTEIDDHVNQKALNGIFQVIEKKEFDIRKNESSRETDLLRKVFAKQD
jgi:hypothetical protein